MFSTVSLLLCAAAGISVQVATAQTIEVGGQEYPADETTVVPAWEEITGADTEATAWQLTEAVLANLTELKLSGVSLFKFGDYADLGDPKETPSSKCKAFPGDTLYPNQQAWDTLGLLTGGALIKTVPIGAPCFPGEYYDAVSCQYILDNWSDCDFHVENPTSLMSPLFEGQTCMPQNAATGANCTIGGFPVYSINATNVAQIQLGLNFARNLNVRLVVRNTGHDFLGKSTGAGSLNIWTQNLHTIQFLENYESAGSYSGPAFKLGAGIMVHELYEAADKEGYTAVGGICQTVGVTGGYMAGGGHSPMSPLVGLGADQILSIEIVTPDGHFITVDEKQNPDLFWAIRGGGASTWGVVVSMTVKVHPKTGFSGMTFNLNTSAQNIPDDAFFAAVEAYWRRFPEYSEQKTYAYSELFPLGDQPGYAWSMVPWIVPHMALADFQALVKPLLDEWAALGVTVNITYFEHDTLYETWVQHFPVATVSTGQIRTASRLIPRANWEDAALLNATIAALRSLPTDGSALIYYNINAAQPAGTAPNAANPAWRDALMFAIVGKSIAGLPDQAAVDALNKKITYDWMGRLRNVTPGGGGYGNEGDVMEPDFGQAFFGDNYDRLYALKQQVDPWGLFYATTAVGSEDWYIDGLTGWLTVQTGRLCRK